MLIVDLVLALLFALIVSLLFLAVLKTRNPWASFPLFLLILFLATWAGGAWMSPFGPVVWGSPILPFLFIALIVGLLLAAAAAAPSEDIARSAGEHPDPAAGKQAEREVVRAIGVFFWILVVILLVALIVRYLV
ncbi:MAG: hypothetical protein ACLFOY_15860 [Desulfatibacillaceae bacterium]